MENSIRNLILAVAISGGLLAVEQPPASSGKTPEQSAEAKAAEAEVKAVMETIQSLSGVIEGLEATANSAVAEETKGDAKSGDAAKAKRPAKNSIAIITAGAAAGASIGAATKKGTQAIVIGAIAGAAAGLIYDRMTANPKEADPKENAEPAPATVSGVPAKAPESVPVAPKAK